jgi:hypothetical protein
MTIYYHILEYGKNGQIAYHRYFTKLKEAEKEVKRLKFLWPDLDFFIEPSNFSEEPPIVNI